MNVNRDRYGNFIEKALGDEGTEVMGNVGKIELERLLKMHGI